MKVHLATKSGMACYYQLLVPWCAARALALRAPAARLGGRAASTTPMMASQREPYVEYGEDEYAAFWREGMDDEGSLTFSAEHVTLSGEGHAFGDLTVADVAADYRFPASYVAESIASFGVAPPILDSARVGDLLDADQCFALLEAVTSLDAAEVEDAYVAYDLRAIAGFLGADLADVFALCVDRGFALPHGVETQLRREQYYDLREALGFADAPPPESNANAPPARYEDFGFKPLDETAEPMDPAARAMADYVQDADRPTYLDGN